MDILYLLIPLSTLVLLILGVFAWALHRGQFDDLEREGERILQDDAVGVDADQTSVLASHGTIHHSLKSPTRRRVMAVSSRSAAPIYTDDAVRWFALATVLWGVVGMLVGVIIAAQLAWPRAEPGHSVAELRAAAPAAHQRGDLRLRRLRALRHQLPRGAAHLPDAAVPAGAGQVHLLRLAAGDPGWRRSRCRWASRRARNTPSSSGRSTC